MTDFYLILAGASGLYLAIQLVALVFFDKRLFPNTGELFEKEVRRIDLQTLFPKNLLRLIIFLFTSSIIGLILSAFDIVSWLSLPCAAVGGLAVNFLISTVASPLYFRYAKSGEPDFNTEEGVTATVTERITDSGYGRICVENGGRKYYYNAVTANGNDIEKGKTVAVITYEDGLCFVESIEKLYDVLFDDSIDETI